MKSISDILNSMVQPTEQHSLLGGNQGSSPQGTDPFVGSFSDVLSRLNSQTASTINTTSNMGNGAGTGTNNQNAGLTGNSTSQITVTDVQVIENVKTNNLNSNILSNVENAAIAMTLAMTKLVNLASTVQNLNQTQAQNLVMSASGGVVSDSQAQQLVTQIANLKNQNNGQNALALTSEQQNALLLQMIQSMIQNQQVTLTQSSDTQNNQNSLSTGSQGSSLLQFNFKGNENNQNGSEQIESLSIDIQTLNLQVSNANSAQSTNLTDATTQKLTQLLQQLNVTPSNTPTDIQVQSSVPATNSPELTKNFQNLVQILTLAGAGQAVLNNFLIQNENRDVNNNFGQVSNQSTQSQTVLGIQSVSVPAVDETESANSTLISNNGQNNSAEGRTQLLNNSLGGQNIQLTIQNNYPTQTTSFSNNIQNLPTAAVATTQTMPIEATDNQIQTPLPMTNIQAPQIPVGNNLVQNASVEPIINQLTSNTPVANVQTSQVSVGNNVVQNALVEPVINRPTPDISVANVQTPQVQVGNNVVQNSSVELAINQLTLNAPATNVQTIQKHPEVTNESVIQTNNLPGLTIPSATNGPQNGSVQLNNNQTVFITPVVANVPQTTLIQPNNDQPQSATSAINKQTIQVSAANPAETNIENQSAANPDSQTALSQPRDVFSNGQLEALNGIVARFNNAVVSGQAVIPNVIDYKNNINVFPSETQAETQVLNQATPVQEVLSVQAAAPIVPTVNEAVNVVLISQNTQQVSNLTNNNIQNQLVQPTSPTTQQVINTTNDSAQNLFAQTAATPIVTNFTSATVGIPGPNQTNNSVNTINSPTPTVSAAPAILQIVTANQSTLTVAPSSTNTSGSPVTVTSSAPVITQPVVNPAVTAQNVPAATVAGEAVKASIPSLVQTSANTSNAQSVPAVPAVSAGSSVQPVTAQAVTQTTNSSETSANLNTSGNSAKDTLANTTNLQNLAAAVNAGVTASADKIGNTFQNTVNTVANSNPNSSVDSAQIMNQISQQVASQTADAKMVSRLNFQLVPESLGRVTIQVALVDQSISARIMVTNPDVREVLQQHMVDLKAALNQAGLQIDQMQVQVQGGGSNLLAQYYQYQQEGNSYREPAWTPINTPEQTQNTDNSGILAATGSSTLNFLV